MKIFCGRASTLLSLVVLLASFAGCKQDMVQAAATGAGTAMSGAPTFNERFQVRNPRTCRTVTSPPSPEEARALVQCAWEGKSTTSGMNPSLSLVTDLQVQMSAPHPFRMGFINPAEVDTSGKVYDLRGQGTSWNCSPVGGVYVAGKNCSRSSAVPKGVGACWHTTFGDWKCEMTVGGGEYTNHLPGPRAY